MIKNFSVLYVGNIDLENVGLDGTPANVFQVYVSSEPNDEDCDNIPGPVCDGAGPSPGAGGEDYVHIHAGIHGIDDLVASERDWRNPVAYITITRVKNDRDGDGDGDDDDD